MQQLVVGGRTCAHRQGELSLRTDQAPGALDEFAPQGVQLFERPQLGRFSVVFRFSAWAASALPD